MVFASLEFLFGFLPVFLLVYFLCPSGLRNAWILLASLFFYAWWSPSMLWVLLLTTLWTWAMGWAVDPSGVCRHRPRCRRLALALAILLLIGLLAFFKYINGLALAWIPTLRVLGLVNDTEWSAIALPIGISFMVLQAVSYLVDVHRSDVSLARNPVDFGAYQTLFSQLVAGPIVRYSHVATALRGRSLRLDSLNAGARAFWIGLSMKVILADTLAPLADLGFSSSQPLAGDAWLAMSSYSLQLYFDFAGYSTMAIGLGLMMGFQFPENFRDPYLATDLAAFWRRWHMTLGSWLRDYLYIPLGGNRRGPLRLALITLLVMSLSGLWHGANSANFLVWGLLHGLALVWLQLWRRLGLELPSGVGWAITLGFVMLAWVPFRADGLPRAFDLYAGLVGLHGAGLSSEMALRLQTTQLLAWAAGIAAVAAPLWRPGVRAWLDRLPGPLLQPVELVHSAWPLALGVISMALLAARGSSPFLYFQF